MTVELSDRERETVVLFTSGLTARQVSVRMGVTEFTVDSTIKRAKAKYVKAGRAARTKLELRDRAVEDRLIDPRGGLESAEGGLLGPGAWSPVTSPTARKLRILYRPTGALAVTS